MAPCNLAHGSGTTWHSAYISVPTPQPSTHVFTPTDIKEWFSKTRLVSYGINIFVILGDAQLILRKGRACETGCWLVICVVA